MKVAVGADFSAIARKNEVKAYLIENGYEVLDLGQNEGEDQLIYPEAAKRIALAVQSGEAERGIIFCGTGGGVSIMANKFRGIYCVASESMYTAFKMRQLNGANVLAMGKNVAGEQNTYEIVNLFLTTDFCQDFAPERGAFVNGLRRRMLEIEAENLK
mgnify:FL=1